MSHKIENWSFVATFSQFSCNKCHNINSLQFSGFVLWLISHSHFSEINLTLSVNPKWFMNEFSSVSANAQKLAREMRCEINKRVWHVRRCYEVMKQCQSWKYDIDSVLTMQFLSIFKHWFMQTKQFKWKSNFIDF